MAATVKNEPTTPSICGALLYAIHSGVRGGIIGGARRPSIDGPAQAMSKAIDVFFPTVILY
jgi:hypothetical protein